MKKKKSEENCITLRETLLGVLLIALVFFFAERGFRTVENFEMKTLDLRFQARELLRRHLPGLAAGEAETMPRDKVIVVGIDEATKDMIEKIEVSRDLHAAAVENLFRAGARQVTLDIVFDKELDSESDTSLSRVLERYRDRVVIGGQWKAPAAAGSKVVGDSLTLPARPFLQAGPRVGLVNSVLSADGVVRTLPLLLERPSTGMEGSRSVELYPGLAFASWLNWRNRPGNLHDLGLEPGQTGDLELPDLQLQTARSFVSTNSQFGLPTVFRNTLVNFQGPIATFRCISLADVVDLARLEERLFRWTLVLADGKLQTADGKSLDVTPPLRFQDCGSGVLTGTVDGLEPADSAEVIAYSFRHGIFGRAAVNADGDFRIEGLKTDDYRISLRVSSLEGQQQTEVGVGLVRVEDGRTTRGLRLRAPGGRDRLQVRLENPATGEVRLNRLTLKLNQPTLTQTTDEEGRFHFQNLPSAPAKLSATLIDEETYDSISLREDLVLHSGGGPTAYSILYRREKGYITGRLVRNDGSPLVGATVAAFQPIPSVAPIFRHYRYFVDTTDADGRFRLGRILEAGLFNISVTIPDGVGGLLSCFEPRGVWVPSPVYHPDPVGEWFVIDGLQMADGEIQGRLLDQDGRPRAGVSVQLNFFSLAREQTQTPDGDRAEFPRLFPGKYILVGTTEPGSQLSSEERFRHLDLKKGGSQELSVDPAEIANRPAALHELRWSLPAGSLVEEALLVGPDAVRRCRPDAGGNLVFAQVPDGYHHLLVEARTPDGIRQCGTVNLAEYSLRDSVVFIGTRARLDLDYYSTPFDSDLFRIYDHIEQMFGVEIHAHLFHTLANNAGIRRVGRWSNRLILGALLLLVLVWMQKHTFLRGFVRILLVLAALIALAVYLFVRYRLWIDLWLPLAGLGLVYLFSVSYRYQQEQKRKKQIRGIFEAMVPPSVVDQCLKNDGMAKVSGKREYLSVLFSDIRGFTPMSESMTPEEVVEILNEYMGEMTKIIFANKGTLDKFIGDAIMVIFGAPVPYDDHAYWATRCACQMREKLQELRKKWGAEGKFVINVGIGVNTGDMVVGNMGSKERMNYTVIGDAVNLSARLEANTKGGQILISAETFKHIKDKVIFEKPDPIKVKGKSMLITIYDILGMKEELVGDPVPVEETKG